MRCLSKIILKNLILLVSSIVADPILILVKCDSFLYKKIMYFVLSALIQVRFAVSQLLTLLSSLLRVNVNSRAFSSANEVDRVLSSANSINLNKDYEFGRSFINIRNNKGPRTDPYTDCIYWLHWLHSLYLLWSTLFHYWMRRNFSLTVSSASCGVRSKRCQCTILYEEN